MLKNYIKIAFRNMWRQKGYTSINIFGLAVGLAIFILVASVPGIFAMITKEFVVLQCLALLIAVPLSYYVYDLAPGGYKYSVQVADIALPVIVILAFTLVMVLYQCLKAAWANPVESLRSE